jgi:hypothetical protein
MCVTNTTHRRVSTSSTVSLTPTTASAVGSSASEPWMLQQQAPFALTSMMLPSMIQPLPFDYGTMNSIRPTKQHQQRRRKPQKPGKTAKLHDRHFVVHDYHDHMSDGDASDDHYCHESRAGSFPMTLHAILHQVHLDGLDHIISWQPHGRCFVVHDPKAFLDQVLVRYFRQTKMTSFQRQLNLYGFNRLTRGPDAGGYYHELFLRGKDYLCKRMMRIKVKGTRFKAASSPDCEPDFYRMLPVVPAVHEDGSVSDKILDEAVDELFFQQGSGVEEDNLAEFCNDWAIESVHVLNDEMQDLQLGFILDRLLKD